MIESFPSERSENWNSGRTAPGVEALKRVCEDVEGRLEGKNHI
jgi:hypothetical protein